MKTENNTFFISFDSKDILTVQLKGKGINNLLELLSFLRKLPYGRNKNRTDFSLILSEMKGTCSSKHAFAKEIVNRNKIEGINLILGIYRMNKLNTPKIGSVLNDYNLEYIPEAHCYLQVMDEFIDITMENSDIKNIRIDVLEEKLIKPEQVSEYKVDYHQSFLKKWLSIESIPFTFDEIWEIREHCISNLSK